MLLLLCTITIPACHHDTKRDLRFVADLVSWLLVSVTWRAVSQHLLSSLLASFGQQGPGWMN